MCRLSRSLYYITWHLILCDIHAYNYIRKAWYGMCRMTCESTKFACYSYAIWRGCEDVLLWSLWQIMVFVVILVALTKNWMNLNSLQYRQEWDMSIATCSHTIFRIFDIDFVSFHFTSAEQFKGVRLSWFLTNCLHHTQYGPDFIQSLQELITDFEQTLSCWHSPAKENTNCMKNSLIKKI